MAKVARDMKQNRDPKILGAFARIAHDLYDCCVGYDGADLKDELAAVVSDYYSAGI